MNKIIKNLGYTSLLICLIGNSPLNAGGFDLDAELAALDQEKTQADNQLQTYKARAGRYDQNGALMSGAQTQLTQAKTNAILAIRASIVAKTTALQAIEDSRDSHKEKMVNFTVTEADILGLAGRIAQLKADADQTQELRTLTAELEQSYDALLGKVSGVKRIINAAVGG
jgi:multidrug efflux pump subunit AcrA (membrane-fusion protein)